MADQHAKSANYAITLTFGECAENHVGMVRHGSAAGSTGPRPEGSGFTHQHLVWARDLFRMVGCEDATIHTLDYPGAEPSAEPNADSNADRSAEADAVPDFNHRAWVLVVPGGVNALLKTTKNTAADLEAEQRTQVPDTKALMYGRVVNKHARHNLCFGPEHQEANVSEGRGTVVAFDEVPVLRAVRERLPVFFGLKTRDMVCEGNYYYDTTKCGIGFHGDAERRLVMALRLGSPLPLVFKWFVDGQAVGNPVSLDIPPGAVYAMSEKAVGTDWKKRKIPTLRHAAGCSKFTELEPAPDRARTSSQVGLSFVKPKRSRTSESAESEEQS